MCKYELAIETAKKSTSKFRVGSIVLDRGGRVLSTAPNNITKTHPVQARYAQRVGLPKKIYLHAEISALITSRGYPYEIIVARLNSKSNIVLAKPCNICWLAILEAGIRKVTYSNEYESWTTERI